MQLVRSAPELYAAALRGEPCQVLGLGAGPTPLPVAVWAGPVTASDEAILRRCRGRTLDVGCGPGRLTAALASYGHEVTGIDVVPEAVRMTRAQGVDAHLADVLTPGSLCGTWDTVLLADGNIGIGGDPERLLRRARQLLAPRGRVIADVAPPGVGLRSVQLRLRSADGVVSEQFPWSVVGVDRVAEIGAAAGLKLLETCADSARWFVVLEQP
jgi:SAM-dependent methyltransferase